MRQLTPTGVVDNSVSPQMPFACILHGIGFPRKIPGLLDGLRVRFSAEFRILPNHFELPTL
jgi:hypothetical protein